MAMINLTDVIVFVLGAAILVFWFVLYIKGNKKYPGFFDNLNKEDYPLKELYFVGYAFQEMVGMEYKTKHDRTLRRQLSVLYGEKYVNYYLRVVYSKQITLTLLIAATAAPFYFLSEGSIVLFLTVLGGAALIFYYYGTTVQSEIEKRNEKMLLEFPDVVSKLALLINAGMILREAWEQVAFSKNGLLYQEMQASVIEMQNGVSEQDALLTFGQRCMIPEVKKFASTLIQGITKGNRELAPMMIRQSEEAWMSKQHIIKRLGEAANSKLLFPICLTFLGILVMVIVPIFSNLGM